jgi:hypothetical protein
VIEQLRGFQRYRRRAGLAACLLASAFLASVTSGCGGTSTASSDHTSASATVAKLSADDQALLAQGEPGHVARVDYSAFPAGGDPSSKSGRNYYVAPGGDDSSSDPNGGDIAHPFRTIEKALAAAKDGDRVFIRAGTYATSGLEVSQSSFLLASYEGESVHIVATEDGHVGLSLAHEGQHDVTVQGLSLEGFSDEGIYLGNKQTMHNIVLQDLNVSDSTVGMAGAFTESTTPLVDGMLVKHVDLLNIRDVGFEFSVAPVKNLHMVGVYAQLEPQGGTNAWQDGVALVGGDNVLIENTIVEGAGGDGLDLKVSRIGLVNCIVRHTGRNGLALRKGGDIVNTLVFDTKAAAQVICGAGDYRILNSVFAYHNMEGGERAFTATFGLDQEGTKTKVLIANCVFYRLPGAVFGFSAATQPFLYNTFFYDFPDVFCYWGENQYFTPGELPDANQAENQTVDPNFSDAEAGDFHPASGSPLLEAGTTGHNAPGFDLLLEQRSGSNTVGVFQNASSGATQPVPSSSTTVTP